MKFDSHGIPILNLEDKLASLEYCIRGGHTEDAVGHLVDLMHHVAPEWDRPGSRDARIVDGYRDRPTPIDESAEPMDA